jgi:hypothetical protein
MKRVLRIWSVGAGLNILWIGIMFFQGFFHEARSLPWLWIGVNFLPLTLVIGFASFRSVSPADRWPARLLLLFVVGCFLSLYTRFWLDSYADFLWVLRSVPFFFLPLQLVIIFLLVRPVFSPPTVALALSSAQRQEVLEPLQRGNIAQALDKLQRRVADVPSAYRYVTEQKSRLASTERERLDNLITEDEYQRQLARLRRTLLNVLVEREAS